MKKMLRKFTVLFLAIALIAMPTTTAFAASNAVVDYDADGFTSISFKPDPYYLAGGYAYTLSDITESNGQWHLPAGKSMTFTAFTQEQNTTARILVLKNGAIIFDNVSSSTIGGYNIFFTSGSTSDYYTIVILAYTNLTLTGYSAYVH